MAGELTVLNNENSLQTGGLGIDFNNPLFKLKPATLSIVQPSSTVEGANKGNLRIVDTGDEFKEMYCALLTMPVENRSWYIGETGELNRTPENLMCFSLDMIEPHKNSKSPQAVTCASCSRSDWKPFQEYKKQYGKNNKALIPTCDAFYKVYLIDTVYQLPLRMYIRAKAKQPFEQGMQNVARTIAMAKAQQKNPNIFDVKFKLSTKLVQDGVYKYYVPVISEPKFIDESERAVFGAMYATFTSSQASQQIEDDTEAAVGTAQTTIDNAVTGGPTAQYQGEDGTITI